MKIKSLIAVFSAVVLAVSCAKEAPVVNYLEVTPNNIAGEWQLVEWNGTSLNEGTYMYLDLVRKDKKFTIYQNFDSMGRLPHVVTGNFNIVVDIDAVIKGKYDHDEGLWAHDYIVRDLTKDSMTWIAADDPTFVQKFVRCPVPEKLK